MIVNCQYCQCLTIIAKGLGASLSIFIIVSNSTGFEFHEVSKKPFNCSSEKSKHLCLLWSNVLLIFSIHSMGETKISKFFFTLEDKFHFKFQQNFKNSFNPWAWVISILNTNSLDTSVCLFLSLWIRVLVLNIVKLVKNLLIGHL